MKTIGLLGGMSWESTSVYYNIINTIVKQRLGGFHSAKCVLYSVDFHELEENFSKGDWDKNTQILTEAALNVQKGSADFLLICTNTMHKIADKIQEKLTIPIIHIADVTADNILSKNIKKVALLGTKYTMEQDFYSKIIENKGIEVVTPALKERDFINHIIFKELCLGIITETSKKLFLDLINKFRSDGVQGVILGCTEIGLLIKQADTTMPLFDTTIIHAEAAVDLALS
ncbi:aspartate/glutamate racemase family protein [Desulfovibrio litoralis]|uniref:Aspartate racemase n=1 Tax=Desulfovibrio litoralis DSM 11393 TaxID=1121455 RepID=A0A1M7S701_9BACT|nr:aspartate/glutamate racemase family protein [Desulfovibrio litoralis]SHN54122.1 aspartate racemase [Desulfovibrio litoralis DSM 11393]